MTVITQPTDTGTAPGPDRRQQVLTVLLVLAGVLTTIAASYGALIGSKPLLVLPVALAVGGGLAALALTRFADFVFLLLVVRASMDMIKLGGHTAGTTGGGGLDVTSAIAMLLLISGAAWLAAQVRRDGSLAVPGTFFRRALLAFAVACTLSVLGSSHPVASAQEVVRVLSAVMMYLVLEQLMVRESTMRTMLLAFFLSAVFPITFTLLGLAAGHARSESKFGFVRLTGTFTQSNDFGRYLMVMILMGAALYPYLSRQAKRWMMVLLATAGLCLLLTLTVAAIGATVVGLLIIGAVQSRKLVVVVLAALALSLLAAPDVVSRVGGATGISSPAPGTDAQGSLEWRFTYWAEVLPLANSNPVTGIGLDGTQYETDVEKQPHGDLVRAYVETGLIGLLSYLALLGSMLALGRRALKLSLPGTFDRGVAVGFLAIAVAFTLNTLVANVFSNVVFIWYVFLAAAAATSVVRRRRQADAELQAMLTAPPATPAGLA